MPFSRLSCVTAHSSLRSSFLPLIKPPHVRAQGSREICSLRLCRGIWAGRAKYQKQEPAHVMGPTPCPGTKPHEAQLPHMLRIGICGEGSKPGQRDQWEGEEPGGHPGQLRHLPLSPLDSVPGSSQPALAWHRKRARSISQWERPRHMRDLRASGEEPGSCSRNVPQGSRQHSPKVKPPQGVCCQTGSVCRPPSQPQTFPAELIPTAPSPELPSRQDPSPLLPLGAGNASQQGMPASRECHLVQERQFDLLVPAEAALLRLRGRGLLALGHLLGFASWGGLG